VRVGRAGFIQALERAARGLRQPAAVGDAGPLLVEGGEFALAELHGLQLLHLVAQQVEAGVPIARRRFHRDAAVHQREPGGARGADLAAQRLEPAETVEQLALCGRAHRGLKFMLAGCRTAAPRRCAGP
jgi:hypothetical protein